MTPRQEELQRQMNEAQKEFEAIDEQLTARTEPFPDMDKEAGCKNCQEKLDAIPLDERKVTGVLTRKGDVGGLLYFANGASTQEIRQFGTSVLRAIMETLKNDPASQMMFSLELDMFMKNKGL